MKATSILLPLSALSLIYLVGNLLHFYNVRTESCSRIHELNKEFILAQKLVQERCEWDQLQLCEAPRMNPFFLLDSGFEDSVRSLFDMMNIFVHNGFFVDSETTWIFISSPLDQGYVYYTQDKLPLERPENVLVNGMTIPAPDSREILVSTQRMRHRRRLSEVSYDVSSPLSPCLSNAFRERRVTADCRGAVQQWQTIRNTFHTLQSDSLQRETQAWHNTMIMYSIFWVIGVVYLTCGRDFDVDEDEAARQAEAICVCCCCGACTSTDYVTLEQSCCACCGGTGVCSTECANCCGPDTKDGGCRTSCGNVQTSYGQIICGSKQLYDDDQYLVYSELSECGCCDKDCGCCSDLNKGTKPIVQADLVVYEGVIIKVV